MRGRYATLNRSEKPARLVFHQRQLAWLACVSIIDRNKSNVQSPTSNNREDAESQRRKRTFGSKEASESLLRPNGSGPNAQRNWLIFALRLCDLASWRLFDVGLLDFGPWTGFLLLHLSPTVGTTQHKRHDDSQNFSISRRHRHCAIDHESLSRQRRPLQND